MTLKYSKQEKKAVGFLHFSAVSIGSAVTNVRLIVLMAGNNFCFVKTRPPQNLTYSNAGCVVKTTPHKI